MQKSNSYAAFSPIFKIAQRQHQPLARMEKGTRCAHDAPSRAMLEMFVGPRGLDGCEYGRATALTLLYAPTLACWAAFPNDEAANE
jgi:hypothetical protein